MGLCRVDRSKASWLLALVLVGCKSPGPSPAAVSMDTKAPEAESKPPPKAEYSSALAAAFTRVRPFGSLKEAEAQPGLLRFEERRMPKSVFWISVTPPKPEVRRHIELMINAEQDDPAFPMILRGIKEAIAVQDRKAYAFVSLPEPVFGIAAVGLIPAGELSLSAGLRVELLRLSPMSEKDMEEQRETPDSQWVSPEGRRPNAASYRARWTEWLKKHKQ